MAGGMRVSMVNRIEAGTAGTGVPQTIRKARADSALH